MKKKLVHRKHHRITHVNKAGEQYFVVIKSWMFLVAFAMMLGLGAIAGNFINEQINQSTPQVAGASIDLGE